MRGYVPPDGNIVVAPASARGIVTLGALMLVGFAMFVFLLTRIARRRD
jgi:hypothetical protein